MLRSFLVGVDVCCILSSYACTSHKTILRCAVHRMRCFLVKISCFICFLLCQSTVTGLVMKQV